MTTLQIQSSVQRATTDAYMRRLSLPRARFGLGDALLFLGAGAAIVLVLVLA